MTYVEGFVIAVPTANKDKYRDHAERALPLFREFGALRMVEAWGDDVPDGKRTDFRRAVKATADETVLFSWIEYADRAARDAAVKRMMTDERMAAAGADMPFDGKRMIFGGFAPFVEHGGGGGMGYADGYLLAVADADRQAYAEMATRAAAVFADHGATRVVEAWGDDVPSGEHTDFARAVELAQGESVVFSWVEWPSKAVRDAAWPKLMEDNRMKPDTETMPFDGQRMVYGGFAPIVDR